MTPQHSQNRKNKVANPYDLIRARQFGLMSHCPGKLMFHLGTAQGEWKQFADTMKW
jgi:hypothetical protein